MRPYETRSLELIASALSEEYGVIVRVGGLRVSTKRDTNGIPVITIPAISSSSPDYRLLIRGYIDHEAGHLRFSDEKAIENGIMSNLTIAGAVKAIGAIYEDIYVDRLMGECFIGCRRNLRQLAYYVYLDKAEEVPDANRILFKYNKGIIDQAEMPWHIWHAALRFLILAGRLPTLPKLETIKEQWERILNILAPGLVHALQPPLAALFLKANNSAGNMQLAVETANIISNYFINHWNIGPDGLMGRSVSEISWLLRNGGEERDSSDLGANTSALIDQLILNMDSLLQEAGAIRHCAGSTVWRQRVRPLSESEKRDAIQSSAKISAKMRGLLQSHVLNREGPFRRGKLQTRGLHKLYIGRDDIFCRNVERRQLDTEIVLCIDMSGSMRFDGKADTASRSLYAIALSLAHIHGLRFHILGFYDNNVIELLKPNAPLTNHLAILPDGGTLLGTAALEAAQCMPFGKRRIIIMLTDGDANDPDNFKNALVELRKSGIEFLGIGIRDSHILDYLPEEDCRVITDLRELAESILTMLRHKMRIRV